MEQLKVGQRREHIQQTVPCVSIGLVVRHYWNNLIQIGNHQLTAKQVSKEGIKTQRCEENTTLSASSSLLTTKSDIGPQSASIVSHCTPRTVASAPQNRVNGAPSCPTQETSSDNPLRPAHISTDTRNVSCQTIKSSLVPCDACAQVQSSLRETGDAVVKLCQSEGIPCSLQRLLVAVDDTLEWGWLTAGDVAQWSAEQCRDMGRLRKHLLEVRSTVQPLRERQTSRQQLEKRLQESEDSREEAERRLQEGHEELRRGTLYLEDSISKLKTERSFQQEKLHNLESERDNLHHEVKALQLEAGARIKLEEKTHMLEAQLCATQLLLDKENSKYQNACRQQESLQAKQKSLLERLGALDLECEELQGQLEESEGRETELQDRLTRISEEKKELQTQHTQEQQEKQKLESHVTELRTSVDLLRVEVQELAQSERLLVAFPELNPLPQGPPQSTGDVLGDMEQQMQANCVRIRVLEQENGTLCSSLMKLRNKGQLVSSDVGSGTTSPSSCGFSQPLHNTPGVGQSSRHPDEHNGVLRSSSAGASHLPATSGLFPSAVRTYEKIHQATRPHSLGRRQRKK